jgi:uncharacterized protein YndB with AHSA1/START domain
LLTGTDCGSGRHWKEEAVTDDHHGVLGYDDESESVLMQFERVIPARPRKVWRHLLDGARLQEWLTNEPGGIIQRRVGGEVFLPTASSGDIVGEVTVFKPEAVLAYSWVTLTFDGGDVQWTVEAAESGGTDLWLEHYAEMDLGLDHYARSLATWHVVLDRFEASLAGRPVPMDYDQWQRHYGDYLNRFLHQLESLMPPTAIQAAKEPATEE